MVTKESVNRSGLDDPERKEGRWVGEEAAGKLGLPCVRGQRARRPKFPAGRDSGKATAKSPGGAGGSLGSCV